MTKMLEVYKCQHCSNIAQIIHPATPAMSCCGEEMKFGESDGSENGGDVYNHAYGN